MHKNQIWESTNSQTSEKREDKWDYNNFSESEIQYIHLKYLKRLIMYHDVARNVAVSSILSFNSDRGAYKMRVCTVIWRRTIRIKIFMNVFTVFFSTNCILRFIHYLEYQFLWLRALLQKYWSLSIKSHIDVLWRKFLNSFAICI